MHRVLHYFGTWLPIHVPVHMLGTGCMGFHSSTMTIDWRRMEPGKIDEQVAIQAQEERVPMVCLPRETGWLSDNSEASSVEPLSRNLDLKAEAYQRRISREWRIFIPDNFAKVTQAYSP
jgi:hypothetical protein